MNLNNEKLFDNLISYLEKNKTLSSHVKGSLSEVCHVFNTDLPSELADVISSLYNAGYELIDTEFSSHRSLKSVKLKLKSRLDEPFTYKHIPVCSSSAELCNFITIKIVEQGMVGAEELSIKLAQKISHKTPNGTPITLNPNSISLDEFNSTEKVKAHEEKIVTLWDLACKLYL